MNLQKFCVLIVLFFLTPLIHADVNFPALGGTIIDFVKQLEKIPSEDQGYQRAVNQLRANADILKRIKDKNKLSRIINDIGLILKNLTVGEMLAPMLEALRAEVQEAVTQLTERPPFEVLKEVAGPYFSNLYPRTKIDFSPKKTGSQFGAIAIVNDILLYYIKTHRYGLALVRMEVVPQNQ
jgi:hypothetical protein